MSKMQAMTLCLCVSAMSGCVSVDGSEPSHQPYQPYSYNEMQYYSQSDYMTGDYASYNEVYPRSQASVPDSYHVGASHSPQSAKNRDRDWVTTQNPQSYTIEVADDEKPSQVAKKLYQIPKNDRMAEIKYQRGGKTYYKGLYGSYASEDEARKALNSLPEEVKKGAGIQNWQQVQSHVSD